MPPACYRDAEVLAYERDTLFRRSWLGVGRADQVKAPGDFAALDLAGVPFILLRDKGGRLRAFANTCRHRGARLLNKHGNCRVIRCPFHSWSYRLDGSFIGALGLKASGTLDKAEQSLIAYPTEERAGFAFVSFDPPVASLDEHLGELAALHAPWPLERLVTTRRRSLEVGCNWKAFLEVFNEYYHLPFVHPNSISRVYKAPDAQDRVSGAFASQFGETDGTGGLLEGQQNHALPEMPNLRGRAALGTRYTWVFPNMTFAAGNEALWVYEAYPLGPQNCLVQQSVCFPPETLDHPDFEACAAHYYHRMDAALAEDIPALENQQKGLASPDARQGCFSVTLEPNVAAFAKWYAQRLLRSW